MYATKSVALVIAVALAASSAATAQLRIAQWNITNWGSSSVAARGTAFQTSIYGIAPNGMQMAPDVLIAQEIFQGNTTPGSYPIPSSFQMTGQDSVTAFLSLLNNTTVPPNPNIVSPGDWAAATYVANQGDTGNAFFYRTSKVQLLDTATLGCGFANAPCGLAGGTIDVGSGSAQSPRDNQRWHIRLVGYGAGVGTEIYLYGGHLKASDGSAEQARKVPEAQRVRTDAAALPAGSNYIFGADFNVQTSTRNYYQILISAGTGQFFDPINKPGGWNTNCNFRNIHTQEPSGASTGGMDDRHDQLLISAALRDGQGLSYIPFVPGGNINAAFVNPAVGGCANSGTIVQQNPGAGSTSWYDANHSYRCWGNDGNHYNFGIDDLGNGANSMVGQAIATALIVTVTAGGGHLPVYLDAQVPAKLGAPSGTVDLGTIGLSTPATYSLMITNAADLSRYSKDGTGWGIDGLSYSLAVAGTGFSITGGTGPFERPAAPGAPANSHDIVLDTSTAGPKSGSVTITSDDPDNPTRVITIIANVSGSSPAGACCTGTACTATTQAACSGSFQGAATVCGGAGNPTTCCPANFNQTDGLTIADIFDFLSAWFAGQPSADFNHVGGINIADIFDFLAAWFAGC